MKTRQWNPGHFGSDFRDGAPCMYKYQESGIFVMKVDSLLDIYTCSVLLKSFLGDLGKQYKLPTPLKRHMSGLALQGLSEENLRSRICDFSLKIMLRIVKNDQKLEFGLPYYVSVNPWSAELIIYGR